MSVDEHFDWVTARLHCSEARFFADLKKAVMNDVDIRTRSLGKDSVDQFSVDQNEDGSFTVHHVKIGSPTYHRAVTFAQNGNEIKSYGDDRKDIFSGTLTLNDEQKCRLRVKNSNGEDKELASWQLRKMALDKVLFGL